MDYVIGFRNMAEVEDFENMNENSSNKTHGGARPGAGRPKGTVEPQTIERERAKARFLNRVHKTADELFEAQFNKAVGETYLMVKKTVGSGKDRKSWTEIVTSPEMIRQYIDDELEDTDSEYYYMTTKPADNQAIQGLLDRGFGKATEKVQLGGDGENPLIVTSDPGLAAKFTEFLKSK
jgi:hypothetical protein